MFEIVISLSKNPHKSRFMTLQKISTHEDELYFSDVGEIKVTS